MIEAIKSIHDVFQGCFEPQTRSNNNFSENTFQDAGVRWYAKCRVRVDNDQLQDQVCDL